MLTAGGRDDGRNELSDAEEAVYVELCRLGPSTVAELAAALALPSAVVLQALVGLGSRALTRRPANSGASEGSDDDGHRPRAGGGDRPQAAPARWSATAPDVALQHVLRDREAELAGLRVGITRLLDDYHRSRGLRDPSLGDLVEVVTGREHIEQLWLALLDGAREQVAILDKPPFVQLDIVGPELAVLARGVPVRSVYERATLLQPAKLAEVRALVAAGEQAGTAVGLPFKLALVDFRWGLLPLAPGTEVSGALVVRPSPLLDALLQTFEAQWARAVPVPAPDPQSTDSQVELLTLLAAGMTDERIARRLGVSARTVQRRVSALMSGLGASNRFQAGVQANRRGLL
ncbi:helix-turn-helix transcriptional regulator [Streptacidiphilus sp. P02-A3a]|uniref:helix-turn-helix domain-containing protein n=1 Tax=Streptacidiphilus sp. P02-A3a TaxID=2704468 RepID=UPI0015F83AB2|nr:helix-turn-helix transcriptional regulator [Streptacidiphilus sp. P02-A3a]QMU73397.1 helix-turn-helix transcriptional regulator [Streptacidiphilus sp. P02-A3a]